MSDTSPIYRPRKYTDDEEDEDSKKITLQLKIEDKMEKLLWDIRNYTEEQTVPLGCKLNRNILIEFLYPDIKRMF